MGPPAAHSKILYRNSRLLRMVFLQLHRQQRADLFCDVVLQAEGETVPAHCCILSACSPFFTERLEREMPPKGHKVMLELRGLKIGTLRKLVDFLYTSEMEVSREEAQEVLAAARQLQVSELESLQLEGGKLVKKTLGRRLNRDCLQLSSPLSIPEASLIQSPPLCSARSPASRLVSGKQNIAVKLPCTKGMSNDSNTDQKETKKSKPAAALLGGDKQVPKDPTTTPEPLKAKTKRRPVGAVKNIMGMNERGSLHAQQSRTGDMETTANLQESKKIKLSRPTLPLSPLPIPRATKDCSAVAPNKSSKSIRRLWRQKSPPDKDVAKGSKDSGQLHGFWSPPILPKATKSRKRSSSEPAPSSDIPQETGQIGRVKLRKVINGSCWEVVQESSAHVIKVETSEHALPEEGTLLQDRHLDQKGADLQPARLLPVKLETAFPSEKTLVGQSRSKLALDEGVSGDVNPCELNVLMVEQLGEVEQYNKLASAGELEHMLDLLLADDDTATEELEDMPASCPAPEASHTALSCAGEKEKECSVEVAACPQRIKTENRPPQSEQGATDSDSSKETSGTAEGGPLLDTVCGYLQLVTSQSSRDCFALCRSSSPQLDGWADQLQPPALEKGTARLAGPSPVTLAGDEDQRLLSCNRIETSGAETKSHTQVWQKSPLQYSLDCELCPLLTSLEDEIDVGGVEEPFVSIECVRPDPSPVSECEVDVLN
ncbi:BTB/POZ domain-containing protein 18 [Tiliqua scincoides]|uniref:BTB/POZ domain-containing protein 18 n=1 Tax=Tiliqua scincoides TaxID=71010 RepID=UPI003461AE81